VHISIGVQSVRGFCPCQGARGGSLKGLDIESQGTCKTQKLAGQKVSSWF